MKTFINPLRELKEFNDIKDNLKLKNIPLQVTGCIDSQKCHLIYGLSEDYPWKLIITYSDIKAKEIYEDYKIYDKNVYLYPAKDIIFYSADIHGNAIVKDRLKILRKLIEREPITIITTLDGGMDKILPLNVLKKRVITITEGGNLDLTKLQAELIHLGYERTGQVEGPGEFAVRGGILDIFPPTKDCPYRIELWGDEVDSVRSFDIASQRSIERTEKFLIYPAAEMVLTENQMLIGLKKIEDEKTAYVKKLRASGKTEEAFRIQNIIEEFKDNLESFQGSVGLESYIKYFYEDTISFFDYFDENNSIIFLDEPSRISEKGEAVETEFREGMIGRIEKGYILPGQSDAIYGYKELLASLTQKNVLLLSTMDYKAVHFNVKQKWDFTVRSVNPYNNNFDILVQDLVKWKKSGYRVLLMSASKTRAKRLSEDLREHDLNAFYSEDMDRMHPKRRNHDSLWKSSQRIRVSSH